MGSWGWAEGWPQKSLEALTTAQVSFQAGLEPLPLSSQLSSPPRPRFPALFGANFVQRLCCSRRAPAPRLPANGCGPGRERREQRGRAPLPGLPGRQDTATPDNAPVPPGPSSGGSELPSRPRVRGRARRRPTHLRHKGAAVRALRGVQASAAPGWRSAGIRRRLRAARAPAPAAREAARAGKGRGRAAATAACPAPRPGLAAWPRQAPPAPLPLPPPRARTNPARPGAGHALLTLLIPPPDPPGSRPRPVPAAAARPRPLRGAARAGGARGRPLPAGTRAGARGAPALLGRDSSAGGGLAEDFSRAAAYLPAGHALDGAEAECE